MDAITNNNINNGNKPSLHKSRSNFSQAAVSKGDVGDFQEGYFVMSEMPLPQQRNKTHKTPERTQRKNEHRQYQTRTTKDTEPLQRDSDPNFSNVRIPTSPTRSPPRNKRISNSHSPQRYPQTTTSTNDATHQVPLSPSPHKPRKAHTQTNLHVSNSPPRDKGPSPPSTRWAGPAFSNAPPPSSLPIPDFPPFNPSQSSTVPPSPTPTPSLPSPSKSSPSFMMYQPQPFIHYPSSYVPAAYQGYPLHLGHPYEMHSSHPASLAELSTDLRRMLNINELPVPILA